MPDVRSILFRPMRLVKKTGKIVVASYSQWSKVRTANYSQFNLIVNDDYKQLPPDAFVYNHKGELLYFMDYNPADVPIYDSQVERMRDEDWLQKLHEGKQSYGIRFSGSDNYISYHMPCTDCAGVPCFSHYTQEYVAESYCNCVGGYPERIFDFNPLTVKTVRIWFGWFLYNLNNASLQIGRK